MYGPLELREEAWSVAGLSPNWSPEIMIALVRVMVDFDVPLCGWHDLPRVVDIGPNDHIDIFLSKVGEVLWDDGSPKSLHSSQNLISRAFAIASHVAPSIR